MLFNQPYFDANKDSGESSSPEGAAQQAAPQSFDEWIGQQDDQIKAMYESHIKGLRNTVSATRQERDDLAKQLKELAGKAEKGSELEKVLTENLQKLEIAERRAAFVEEAIKPEIGCRNIKAAWLLASADNLFDRRGNPDWEAIKSAAPELFGKVTVSANAGAGTDKSQTKSDMNAFIRAAAGRS